MLTFLRILKFAFQDFWRNIWLSLVTITVLVLALFSVNILISLNAVSNTVIDSVEEKVDIELNMVKDATEAEVSNFSSYLNNFQEVDSLVYLTKDEVLENFRQKNIDNPEIQEALAEVEENPFSDTFIIKAKSIADYSYLIDKILKSDYEDLIENKNFDDPQKIIVFVQNMTDKVEKFGLMLTLMFGLIALLIVFNTIRVIIYTHKEEIGVMRLVGATNWFIRTPYLIEGILYAVFSMSVMIGLLYLSLYFTQPYLSSLLEDYNFNLMTYFNSHFIVVFGSELLVTIFFAVVSSGIAIRKYLKV